MLVKGSRHYHPEGLRHLHHSAPRWLLWMRAKNLELQMALLPNSPIRSDGLAQHRSYVQK